MQAHFRSMFSKPYLTFDIFLLFNSSDRDIYFEWEKLTNGFVFPYRPIWQQFAFVIQCVGDSCFNLRWGSSFFTDLRFGELRKVLLRSKDNFCLGSNIGRALIFIVFCDSVGKKSNVITQNLKRALTSFEDWEWKSPPLSSLKTRIAVCVCQAVC